MKALAWLHYFEEQQKTFHKKLFSVTELSNVAGVSPHVLNVELGRLVKQGLIARFAQGIYGLPGNTSPEDLLPMMDSGAYITGFYALHSQNMITQVPVEIACFTNRRHNRSRIRETPVGKFIFTCVKKRIYCFPNEDVLAQREQAFCDFLFMACRQDLAPESLITFRHLEELDLGLTNKLLARYPKSVQKQAYKILPKL